MAMHKKAIREQRQERFEESYLAQLEILFEVFFDGNKYTIDDTKFGTIDFFPKANKVLIRKSNSWIEGGLNWIKNNLLTGLK